MPKALSLKYRPKKFSDLIGQDSISQTLSLALELDKVSHAYLFSGLRGSGKTSSARIFAKALQCEKSPTSIPCEVCDSCVAVSNGNHIDIIEMDAASSRGIDDIKNLIEQIQYPPSFGRFKVFIIDEIHMLTKEAFNAFLKTLEEPPNYVKFILATTDPLKLPVTILSRTQHFRFKKIPQSSIATHLKNILALENIKFESEAIGLLSRNCGGSLRDAMTMLEQAIIFSKNDITMQSLSLMLGSLNPEKINEFFEAILLKDDEKLDNLLAEFESYEAENVIDEMIDFLKNKMLEKDYKYNLVILERFFKILGEAKNMLNINADSAFVLLLSLLKMKESLKIQDIDKMIARLHKDIEAQDSSELQDSTKHDFALQNQFPSVINNIADSQNMAKNASNSPNITDSQSIAKNTLQTAEMPSNITDSQNLTHLQNDSNRLQNNYKSEIPQIAKTPSQKFKNAIDKIYERDYDLGELFSKNITFVSFENGILTWESKADSAAKERLKSCFKIIQNIINEIFGKVIIKNAESSKDSNKTSNVKSQFSDSQKGDLRNDLKGDSSGVLKGDLSNKNDSPISMIKDIFPVEKVEVI